MVSNFFRRRDAWSYITLVIFILYIIVLVFPLISLLKVSFATEDGSFTLGNFAKYFSKKYYYGTLFNSIKVTLAVTVASVILATPLAYIMTTFKMRGKIYLQILILISMMAPPFIGAYSDRKSTRLNSSHVAIS